jgi:hypothetical protein
MEHVARSALNFRSKEEAVAFAEKQGFNPVVREPQRRRPDRLKRYAGYGDNFRCCCALGRRLAALLHRRWYTFLHFCASRAWLQLRELLGVNRMTPPDMLQQASCDAIGMMPQREAAWVPHWRHAVRITCQEAGGHRGDAHGGELRASS